MMNVIEVDQYKWEQQNASEAGVYDFIHVYKRYN